MYQRSFCKLILKYPFRQCARPTSPFFPELFKLVSNPCVYDTVSATKSEIFSLSVSKFHSFLRPVSSKPPIQFRNAESLRKLTGEPGSGFDHNKEVDEINLKFAEARDEIETAMESKETVYFDEEAECARAAVKEVLDMFGGLLARLSESERAALQRSMGLKIEQLKAELEQLND